jgi:hypothetical protein
MLYMAIAIVVYGVISNAKDWYYLWHNHRLSQIVKRGWINSPDGRRLRIQK